MVVRVLKTYIFKLYVSGNLFQRTRVFLVKNINIRIHNLQKPLNSGHAALELLGKFYNPADCGNQRGNIQHICDQVSRLYQPLYHKYTAADDNGKVHDTVKQPGGRLERRHIFVAFFLNVIKLPVVGGKFPVFHFLVCKRLNHLLPQQAVLDTCV